MRTRLRVVVAVVALGSSVAWAAGGSRARTAADVEIRLIYGDLTSQHSYQLEDERGRPSAVMELFRGPLLDEAGNEIGIHRCQCVNGSGYGWTCTHIYRLTQGPFTSRGTVVITGVFGGFNGERTAITGGTGAYAGVTGDAIATVEDGAFVHTLHLQNLDPQ